VLVNNNMCAVLKPLSQNRNKAVRVLLDVKNLNAFGQAEWLVFVEFAARILGLKVSIGYFASVPSDNRSDFAYVADSSALSRKLLLNVPLIYIQPRSSPTKIDAYFYWKSLELFGRTSNWQPVVHSVTLISSVFRGDGYLAGFLDNCMALHDYEDCEHFLIRPGSPGNEHARLVEHVHQCPSAVYLNLAEDPGLYEVWNLGSRLATSRYISNANIDDRRAPEHVIHLKQVLDANSDVTVASTALRISKKRNLTWEDSRACEVWFGNVGDLRVGGEGLFEQRAEGVVSRNFPHCMPLWRRSLHARTDGFDEKKYGPSADWAFWVYAGRQGALFHLSAQPLGLYLQDEESYWHRDSKNQLNDQRIVDEFTAWTKLGKGAERRHRSISREISDAIELLSAGAVYEGLSRLLYIAQQNDRVRATELALLNRTAEQFLGCKDFSGLSLCFRNALEAGQLFDSALFNVWIELVNSHNSKSAKVWRTLDLACIDLNECAGDFRGLLLQACIAHKQGGLAYEQLLRKHLLDTNREMFYETLLGFSWKLSCS
jgi:hypothetical protein